jgi:Domain of unknown function DUF488
MRRHASLTSLIRDITRACSMHSLMPLPAGKRALTVRITPLKCRDLYRARRYPCTHEAFDLWGFTFGKKACENRNDDLYYWTLHAFNRRVCGYLEGPRPQYNSNTLAAALQVHAIGYEHLPGLGGLRHAKKDSINTAWENASFRGFADYMQTEDFERSLNTLIEIAGKQSTAILCAEAVPWRCHRSLIADALLAREITVMDIMNKMSARKHTMTPWAHVKGTTITYPKPQSAASAHEPHHKQRKTSPM